MKVAYLLGSLNRGGTETLVLDVFRNASKAPYSMIGIHRKDGAYKDDFYNAGPKMYQCAPKRQCVFSYLLQIRKILLKERVEIVHAQQPLDCLYACLALIGTKVRVVETFHGYDFTAKRFSKIINALSMYWADAVCFVSQSQRYYYLKAYHILRKQKTCVVYNGIDLSKFETQYPIPDFLKTTSKKIRLLMVGNFVHVRAQNVIVESLARLHENGVNSYDFYFVGRKHEKEAWRYENCVRFSKEHRLTDSVHFVGGRGDVPAILQHMDAFIYATAHDTFGIAVVEAMATGLPVVVNDWDVMKEITHDGEWAKLYKTGDIDDCANAIKNLLENIDEAKIKAKERVPLVQKAYSINTHIQSLNDVYKRLINKK